MATTPISAKLTAATLQVGHLYRFDLMGAHGGRPYKFVRRMRDGKYRFEQVGTKRRWQVSATIVTRYLIGEEPSLAPSAVTVTPEPVLVAPVSLPLVPPVIPSMRIAIPTSTSDLDQAIRAAMGTCGNLVVERDKIHAELRRQAKEVLHPLLTEMRKRYNNPHARTDLLPGIVTFEGYLAMIGFSESLLRVWDFRKRQKEIETLLLESLLPNAPVPPKAKQIDGGTPTVGVSQPGKSSVEIDDPDDEETVEDEGEDDEDVGADIIAALTGLKYSRKDATHAVGLAIATANKFLLNDFDYLMRTAIGNLTRVKPATIGNNQAVIARALAKGASLSELCENLKGIAEELRLAFRLLEVAGQIAEIAEGLPKLAATARSGIS